MFALDSMHVTTPCAIIPRSFSRACDHSAFAGVCMRCLYSCMSPVSGLMTGLHCCAVLSGGGPRNLLMLKMAIACCVALCTVTVQWVGSTAGVLKWDAEIHMLRYLYWYCMLWC